MAKKNIYCVFDTETLGIDKKWIYDLGMVIIAKTGKPLFAKRWIIKEVMNIPNISEIAFYGNKMETFYKGKEMVTFAKAREDFRDIMKYFTVNVITAYNLQFDMSAITQTLEMAEIGSKFLNYPVEYFDLWNASCNSIFQQKQFKEIAKKQDWLTNKGNYRTSAEIAYRFITKNYNFIESHTALEDATIEAKILQEVCRQKKGMQKNTIIPMPWKKAQ
jgi:DNA polymerase III epsilon subunit-like protein